MAKKNKFGVASIPGRNEEIIISVNPKEQPPYQQQTGDALDRERNKKREQDAARIRSLFDFYVPTAEEIEWCVRYEYKTGFEVIGYDKPKDRQTFLEFAEYNIQWFRDFARDAAKSAAMDLADLHTYENEDEDGIGWEKLENHQLDEAEQRTLNKINKNE